MKVAHKLIVITGATGTGKTTVSAYLRDNYRIHRVMTHTTRPARKGEENGIDYYFETPSSFATKHFIEKVNYAGYEYGSSHESLEKNWAKHPFLSIVLDTKGAITYVHELPKEVVVLFLTIDDPTVLKDRLLGRGDDPAMVAARLKSPEYKRDLTLPSELKPFATVIKNDRWNEAREQVDRFMKDLALKSCGLMSLNPEQK
ncbi:guanylate kinase [Lacticaseibacillus chiayiensis]|uniref:Guanylate kinase n=1 Tax=Lacticaseibacillus chiayiensis TaxID=2100821 RepID=A0A4Q1TL05_9LACO|nr:guanylate kinase [Lacticaseibacillus chiayiensis]RXT18867.1 guanylate kinase [Lacticaseibacillus chiayiensis]RXT58721.1 guanylate kinase [Lacticaseibacillus chiayiensis]UYN55687.1 guanylate kinase [Lacticaseibacillus chiayiensis]